MVFERVVANVLNMIMGDFVDNLDPSQLNVGIWSGDVKLHKLEIKDNALDAFDLPIKVKVKFGYLNTLIMKIPWKKLYTSSTHIDIEGLYMIIVPIQGVAYNEETSKKKEYETKEFALNILEEKQKMKGKEKEEISDTFTEKLVAQVIKNLQVHIKSIHIRYEDRFSNRDRPFASGITLESLEFQTTDFNFIATIHKEKMRTFYKLVSLNNLAIYLNSNSELISDHLVANSGNSKEKIISELRSSIATKHLQPEQYKYVFGPITTKAKLTLNQKPELDKFQFPKANLYVETEELSLCIRKLQYQDFLYFVDAQRRFELAFRYHKYRPNLSAYQGYYVEWWHFAYRCVLDDLKRCSWKHIKKHRKLLKAYRNAWLHYRTEKNPSDWYMNIIQEAEETLDVFNLNIAREQAEIEVDRQKLIRTENQLDETWGTWAKSWFGFGYVSKKRRQKITAHNIVSAFQKEMTSREKTNLFDAIDYQENLPRMRYPKDYVEYNVRVNVSRVAFIVDSLLQLLFLDMKASLEQQHSSTIHARFSVKSFSMEGLSMLQIWSTADNNWLNAQYIAQTQDSNLHQFLGVSTAPIEVILIEDLCKPDQSRAIILSFLATLDITADNRVMRINATIREFQILSTFFAMQQRNEFCYPILEKTELSLNGTLDEFDVRLEKVHVQISPAVINLLKALFTQLTGYEPPNSAMARVMDAFREKNTSIPETRSKMNKKKPSHNLVYVAVFVLANIGSFLLGYLLCFYF